MVWNEEKIVERIEFAIKCFKASEYINALVVYDELFSECLKFTPPEIRRIRRYAYSLREEPVIGPLVHPKIGSILDQRAAIHEKLGKLTEARLDGEKLIEYEPMSCKGYLRTSKVLLKMKRDIEAYKVLQTGNYFITRAIERYKIGVPEKLFSSLKTQLKELNFRLKRTKENGQESRHCVGLENSLKDMMPLRRLASLEPRPSKKRKATTDPMLFLPLEIIEIIFSRIPLIKVLECHTVCWRWYHTLLAIPNLYIKNVVFKSKLSINEFMSCVRLLKKSIGSTNLKHVNMIKLRSTLTYNHLLKMIYTLLVEKEFKIKGLDILNSHLSSEAIVYLLSKASFKVRNIEPMTFLRLGLKSSLRYENIIFRMMKNLKTLEIVILDSKPSGQEKSLVPNNSKIDDMLSVKDEPYPSLRNLTVVNHPRLMKENSAFAALDNTYSPYPPFIEKNFPNLTNLCIVSYDFTNKQRSFQNFLACSNNLQTIYLENNVQVWIKDFIQDLVVTNPRFRLKKVTIREKDTTRISNLNEISDIQIPQLNYMEYLDVYSSSLSVKALKKLLRIVNYNNQLETLQIGNSNYLYFFNDKIARRETKLSFNEIFKLAPNLRNLCINEMELDNASMKFFYNDVQSLDTNDLFLQVLDLSFCVQIDGIGLMNLFGISSNASQQNKLRIEKLLIDGVEINPGTLKFLQHKNLVKKSYCDPHKMKWKQYPVNTLVPE